MFKLVFLNLKTIIKNKLIIIYLIFFLGCEAVLCKFASTHVDARDGIYLPPTAHVLSIIYFAFFIIYAFESYYNIKDVDLFETFSAKYKGLYQVWLSRLIALFFLACLSTLPILIHYTIVFQKFSISISFLFYIQMLKSILLNFVFVSMIGCMLGALLSIKNNRIIGYFKIAVSVYLVSPWFINVINNIYKRFDNYDTINIFPLINRIQILPPNLLLGDHLIYGLPMESIRWESAIMLLIILAIAILRKVSEVKKRLYTFSLSAIIILWIGFALIITPNDSLVRKDTRYFQGQESDWHYDTQSPQQYKAPDFSITEYNMEFKVRRQLYGDIEIVIGDKSSDNNYIFTLYRGYNIKSVIDNNANELEFERDGHYLTIFANDTTDIINIEYKGNGNCFYSNNQGIALTGNFPYYPVAGYTTIPIQTVSNDVKFNVYVNTKQQVFSNIGGENNHFVGFSDTLTLVSGFLTEYENGNITIVGHSIYEDNIDLDDLVTELANINEKIGTGFYLNKNMKIFYPPDQIFQNVGYIENTMVYDNQIIARWPSTMFICRGIIESSLPDDQDTFILRLAFSDTLFYLDSIRERVSPKLPSENEIEMFKNPSNENYLFKERLISKLLLYKIDTLGENVVYAKVYKYLKDNDNTINQLDFLMEIK